jgi:hypothetical protein
MAFLHNRLSASIDWYLKNTKDLLLQDPIPLYDGGGSYWANLGSVRNQGIDIQLTGDILQSKNWNWESTLTFSYNKNTVTNLGGNTQISPGVRLGNGTSINTAVLRVGQPMGSILGYQWLGLWKTSEADQAALYGEKPGDNHFKDVNNDTLINSSDIDIIGHAFPTKIVGWNNTFSYKRFSVNLFFEGAFGAQRLNIGRFLMNGQNADIAWMTSKVSWYDRWTPQNENTWVPNPFSTTNNIQGASSQFIENANYVRLKNLSFSYLLTKSLIKACDLTLTLSVQNLVTFTKYSGGDPEATMNSAGGQPAGTNDINAGVDALSYPQPRVYTIGAKLTF